MSKRNFKSVIINSTQRMILLAMLTSLSVVCSYFLTYRVANVMKFSPVFIIVALAGYKFGVFGAILISVLSDFIQYMMFPSNGFSIAIFVSNVVFGLIFGLFFYKKFSLTRIIIASILSQTICTVLISSYLWVYVDKWYPSVESIIYPRIIQGSIMIVVIILTLYLLFVKTDLIKKLKIQKI